MLLLPGFLWLAGRVGAWALLPPLLLHAAVQGLDWRLPGLGGTEVAFNPLAWQLLFLLGAWFGRRALLEGAAVRPNRLVTAAALGVVALGLWARLVGHGWLPDPGFATALAEGKGDLAWPRLAHALALAWLVAVLMPRDARWMDGLAGRLLASVGRQSLRVFCLGLLLSWGVGVALRLHPAAASWLDPLMVTVGMAALVGFALRLERGEAARRSLPARAA
jgi:hypothetical protein